MNSSKSIIVGLIFVWILGPLSSFGFTAGDELEVITNKLITLVQDLKSIPETLDKNQVLRHFDKSYQSVDFSFGMNEKPTSRHSDYAGLTDRIERMVLSEGISIQYDVVKILEGKINGKYASLIFNIEYEIKEKKGIWVKGQESVIMTFRKTEDEWMIVYRSSTGYLDETFRGVCLCELFISGTKDGEIIAKTTIPDGQNYTSQFDVFNFKESQSEEWIKVGQRYYTRDKLKDGKVITVGRPEEKRWIGLANNKKETILLLIKNELYPGKCASLELNEASK